MGAELSDVAHELRIIWIQAACYFVLTLVVYRFQFYQARYRALDRLKFLKFLKHEYEVKMKETKEV